MDNTILLFTDSHLRLESYRGLIKELNSKGFSVDINTVGFGREKVHILSHGDGDKKAIHFMQESDLEIGKIIIAAPVHNIGPLVGDDTLILWSNGDKRFKNDVFAREIYKHIWNNGNKFIIGYPNVSFFLFSGVYYSQHHDLMDVGKEGISKEIYEHIDDDVMEDILRYLTTGTVKEKICLCTENYLPCINGVNILTSLLKQELEKLDKKVYITTYRLKGVDYLNKNQEKNCIIVEGTYLPGGVEESVIASFNVVSHAKDIRPYGFDVVHLQNEFTLAKPLIQIARKEKLPLIYTQQTMWDDMFYKRFNRSVAKVAIGVAHTVLFNAALRNYTVMSVPTLKVKEYWAKRHVKKNIMVLPGCVDEDRFAYRPDDEHKIEEIKAHYDLNGKRVMGYVGRVCKEKSIQEIIQYFEKAADIFPDLVFFIVGDGPYLEEIRKQADCSKVKHRIKIAGRVENHDIKNYFRTFDFFCTASTFETQGLTYLESMLSDTLVLARKDHCLDGFIENGVNSLIFTDFESWKKGVQILLYDDKKIYEMKKKAKETTMEYTKKTWAKRYVGIYQQAKRMVNGLQGTFNSEEIKKIK